MNKKHNIVDLDTSNLANKSVRSGMINMIGQAVSVILQLASTIVLARMISPSSFGIVGMVMAVIAFAGLFRDLGLSTATIQRKNLSHEQVSVLFWVNVILGLGLFIAVAICSPLVVWFYDRSELQWITVLLAFNIFLSSIGAQHSALLNRDMRFKEINIAKIVGALGNFIAALIGAFLGLEYWALALGAVFQSLISTSLVWYFSGWNPSLPKRNTGAKEMVKYGLNLTGFEFVNYFSRNLDNVLIGKFIGAEVLGFYTRAYRLIMFPISNIRTPLASVALPGLSSLQTDRVRFRSYYIQLLSLLSMLTMPITAFIFIAAETVVLFILGENWLPVAPIMKWLSLAAFIQPVSGLFGIVLLSLGMARKHLYSGLISGIVLSAVFFISVHFGVETLAIAYAASGYVLFIPIFLFVSKDTGISIIDFISGVWRATISSVSAAIAVYYFDLFTFFDSVFLNLICNFMYFVVIFLFLVWLIPGGKEYILILKNRFFQSIS